MKTLLATMLLVMAGQTAIIYACNRQIKFEKSEQRAILDAMREQGEFHRNYITKLRAQNDKLRSENASLSSVWKLKTDVNGVCTER